jgi:hypothetical protein
MEYRVLQPVVFNPMAALFLAPIVAADVLEIVRNELRRK